MVVNKRSKNSRHRGSWSHGYGSRKKHRGAGSRGGKGLSGTGKRGDQNKPTHWKKKYFGKKGFKKKGFKKDYDTISIHDLENSIEKLISQKLASKEGDVYSVDLTKAGYGKLLSQGKINSKFKITIEEASKKAIEKIKSNGGEIILKILNKKSSQATEKEESKGQ
jgi:large subunit ribosomal protein L15